MFTWCRRQHLVDKKTIRTPHQSLLVRRFCAPLSVTVFSPWVVFMFFRFAAALMLVVAVSMAQIGLEKQSLRLRRSVSRQYYQMDELLELHAQLRLDIQQLSAPSHFLAESALPLSHAEMSRVSDERSTARVRHPASPRLPLLRWERPVRPDGVGR